ncbi:MAG: hypothetical protein U0871_11035 [Gemmataceae bacterium]
MPPKGKAEVNRGEQAFRLAGNVIAYATGLEPPKQRLSSSPGSPTSTDKDRSPPKGFLKPLQLKLRDEPPPAKGAMRNLMAHLQAAARIDAVQAVEELFPGEDDLFKYKFLYLHGRKRFAFTDEGGRGTSGPTSRPEGCCWPTPRGKPSSTPPSGGDGQDVPGQEADPDPAGRRAVLGQADLG